MSGRIVDHIGQRDNGLCRDILRYWVARNSVCQGCLVARHWKIVGWIWNGSSFLCVNDMLWSINDVSHWNFSYLVNFGSYWHNSMFYTTSVSILHSRITNMAGKDW